MFPGAGGPRVVHLVLPKEKRKHSTCCQIKGHLNGSLTPCALYHSSACTTPVSPVFTNGVAVLHVWLLLLLYFLRDQDVPGHHPNWFYIAKMRKMMYWLYVTDIS